MPNRNRSLLAAALKQGRPFESVEQEVYLSLLRTASEMSHAAEQAFRPFGITSTQYNVLRILRGVGAEGLCRNEIAARMVTAVPDVSRLLDRLEKAGLVKRERATEDRRQVSTFITRPGLALLSSLEATVRQFTTGMFAGIPRTDLDALLRVNDHVREKLRPK
jgi:DNA-binding MarR family transcriptional regulator